MHVIKILEITICVHVVLSMFCIPRDFQSVDVVGDNEKELKEGNELKKEAIGQFEEMERITNKHIAGVIYYFIWLTLNLFTISYIRRCLYRIVKHCKTK